MLLVALEAEGMSDFLTWPGIAGAVTALVVFIVAARLIERSRKRRHHEQSKDQEPN